MTIHAYPFGTPVGVCAPHRPGHHGAAAAFVLGAYPSALHVRWTSPDGSKRIRALPVADEPEPFWDGSDEQARIDAWRARVGLDPDVHGTAAPVGGFNGSSGVSLRVHYLRPLRIDPADTWITDCLDTYFASEGVTTAIDEVLMPALGPAAGTPHLARHPSEAVIVRMASTTDRMDELEDQLAKSQAPVVITLGNAASKVMARVLGVADPGPLATVGYGEPVAMGGAPQWLRLAHPAAIRMIPKWETAHSQWIASISG